MHDRVQRALEVELGALLPFFSAPGVRDLEVEEDGVVYLRDGDGNRPLDLVLSESQRWAVLSTVAGALGDVISELDPTVEGVLDVWNVRFVGVVPPLSSGPAFVIRFLPRDEVTLGSYLGQGILTPSQLQWIRESLLAGASLVISGGQNVGKTRFARACLHHYLEAKPELRITTIEDGVRELQYPGRGVMLCTLDAEDPRRRFDTRRLLRFSLRLNTDILVIGELRGPEAHEWLKAVITGTGGSVVTIHASSADDVFSRLEDMISEAGVVPSRRRLSRAIDGIVSLDFDGSRFTADVYRLGGLDSSQDPVLLRVL